MCALRGTRTGLVPVSPRGSGPTGFRSSSPAPVAAYLLSERDVDRPGLRWYVRRKAPTAGGEEREWRGHKTGGGRDGGLC